jgi:2,3-diketo-5-methylthio-1-phosphopentane phosphatase
MPGGLFVKLGVVLDFDGTVTMRDVGAEIVATFAEPGWEEGYGRFRAGEFGGRQAMEWEYRHLPAGRQAEMVEYAYSHGELRPGLRELVELCRANDIPIEIASNGMDFYIQAVLSRDGFGDLPFVAPKTRFTDAGEVQISFAPDVQACDRTGLCKCARVWRLRAEGRTVVYAGDGVSDFCVAGEADIVLARADLVSYCKKQGIAYRPFEDLEDVRAEVLGLLGTDAV